MKIRKRTKLAIVCSCFFLLLTLVIKNREHFLIKIGNYLVHQDSLENSDAMIILSGEANSRALEGFKIFQKGFTKKIYTTGNEIAIPLDYFEKEYISSSQYTANFLISMGLDSSNIVIYPHGTSTFSEYEAVCELVKKEGFKSLIILSSNYHSRRVSRVFKEGLEKLGVKTIIRGAPSPLFDPTAWWKSSNGLIMVNNEYLKLIYYFHKY